MKPLITLDIHLILLRHPSTWPSSYKGLAQLQYHYFETNQIQFCFLPHSVAAEMEKSVNPDWIAKLDEMLGKRASLVNHIKHTGPKDETGVFNRWLQIKDILWPRSEHSLLTSEEKLDVTQLYFHSVVSENCKAAAFVTLSQPFLDRVDVFHDSIGLKIQNPQEAWQDLSSKYMLDNPSADDLNRMWQKQHFAPG